MWSDLSLLPSPFDAVVFVVGLSDYNQVRQKSFYIASAASSSELLAGTRSRNYYATPTQFRSWADQPPSMPPLLLLPPPPAACCAPLQTVSYDDTDTNMMVESLNLFRVVCDRPHLAQSALMLLFNSKTCLR